MKKLGGIAIVAASAVLLIQGPAQAVPSLGNPHQTWSVNGTTEGWTVDPASDNTIVVSHNDPGSYLQIDVTGSGPIAGFGRTITTGPLGTTYFAGDYAAIGAGGGFETLKINFDFLTTGTSPGELQLYFQSGSGHLWAYDVAGLNGSPAANGKTTYAVSAGVSGWVAQNGAWTPGDLLADWASVSWLGVYVQGSSGAHEIYGLDDMYLNLLVPEPGTAWMILAAFLSICVTFRGKITEMAGQMKARAQKG